jgi:DNA-binding response OmpR family regulator
MQPKQKPLLIIVEDDDDVREIVVDSLKCDEFEIQTYINGKEASEAALRENPDAILTDISMPVMNGLQMIRLLRAQEFQQPILILSAFGDRKNTVEALKLGVYDFIDKPFDLDDLRKTVSIAIEYGLRLKVFEKEWQKLIDQSEELKKIDKRLLDKMKEVKKIKLTFPPKKAA